MKTLTVRHSAVTGKPLSYPNAATFRQNLEKLLNYLLSAAICVGIAVIILFLFALA